jgi:hypothetical protein
VVLKRAVLQAVDKSVGCSRTSQQLGSLHAMWNSFVVTHISRHMYHFTREAIQIDPSKNLEERG